jgi:hypothetical protein
MSNINTLGRTSEHSILQARASLLILDCFIDDQLGAPDKNAGKRALKVLRELEYVVRDFHLGQISHRDFGDALDPIAIIERYTDDERIDVRARRKLLRGILDRLGQKRGVADRRRLGSTIPPDA